jgi:hypothetical protein
MAQRDWFLILAAFSMVMGLISTLTGRILVRGRGIVRRTEDAYAFWQMVILCYLGGLLCVGLFLFTSN